MSAFCDRVDVGIQWLWHKEPCSIGGQTVKEVRASAVVAEEQMRHPAVESELPRITLKTVIRYKVMLSFIIIAQAVSLETCSLQQQQRRRTKSIERNDINVKGND